MEEKPQFLVEAQDGVPPRSLESLISECKPSSVTQAINLLVHLTMLECGFKYEGSSEGSGSKDEEGSRGSGGPGFKYEGCLGAPLGWKDMVASFEYSSAAVSADLRCTVVMVTMGEVKQMLISFPGQQTEISVHVQPADYIRDPHKSPVLATDLIHVSQLARTLRDRLLHPLQVSAHQALGILAPHHLAGLPHEILLNIASLLHYRDILALRETCRRLHTAMDDNILWQRLYNRDFRSLYDDLDQNSGRVDWKAKYKEAVKRREELRKLKEERMKHVPLNPYPWDPYTRPYPDPPQPHPTPNPYPPWISP